jgi:2-polyprenyl-6-methoxyphenol hydroxylase-like FAD-dependent oxidoreductase
MSPSDNKPDAVIVGAGIAGGALAVSLARSGYSVTLLEKSTVHVDRVSGEFIVPWGVAEAKALGILDVLQNAGANYTVRSIPYGEEFSPEVARKYTVPMDQMVPGIQGALNLGHPSICNALNDAAIGAGATLLRGVAIYRMEFTDEGRRRRRDGRQRMVADPELMLPFAAMQKAPFAIPSEVFSKTIWDRLLGDA